MVQRRELRLRRSVAPGPERAAQKARRGDERRLHLPRVHARGEIVESRIFARDEDAGIRRERGTPKLRVHAVRHGVGRVVLSRRQHFSGNPVHALRLDREVAVEIIRLEIDDRIVPSTGGTQLHAEALPVVGRVRAVLVPLQRLTRVDDGRNIPVCILRPVQLKLASERPRSGVCTNRYHHCADCRGAEVASQSNLGRPGQRRAIRQQAGVCRRTRLVKRHGQIPVAAGNAVGQIDAVGHERHRVISGEFRYRRKPSVV